MRRITFNAETIQAMRQFMEVEHNSVSATANKFGVSQDTIRRIMFENNISPGFPNKRTNVSRELTEEKIDEVASLYMSTDISMANLCREVKLENYMVQQALRATFSEEEIKQRKSSLYRQSKLGDNNPMKGKTGENHHNWIGGVVEDGQGYLMVKKPEWYTGRKGSDYVFQHSVVMCEALGLTEIPKGFVVHHIDRNTKNNHISNLALMELTAHTRLHQIESKMRKVQRLSDTGVGESPNA